MPLTLLNKLPRFRAWREWGFYLREFQGAEAKGLIMRPHPHLPGAERQGDQKWRVEALAGRMEALGVLPRLRVLELTDDDQVEQRKVEVAELMRQGMLEVIPGMNVKVDAVVTRSLNKAETVPGQVGMPDRDESRVAEQPADGTEDLPLQSSSKVGLWSKKSLVEQEAQRDGS